MIVFPNARAIQVFEATSERGTTFVVEFRDHVEPFPLPHVSKEKQLAFVWEFVPTGVEGEIPQPHLRTVFIHPVGAVN